MKVISSTSGIEIVGATAGTTVQDFLQSGLFTLINPLPPRVRIVTPGGSGTNTPQGSQTAAVASGGSGYTVGDILTISGGMTTGDLMGPFAQFLVTAVVSGAGTVTSVSAYGAVYGSYGTTPSNPASTTGGSGIGCTLNVTWESLDVFANVSTSADIQSTNDVVAMVPLAGYATGPAAYSSSNTAVATIDSMSGVVTPVAAGQCNITITVPGYQGLTRVVPITVVETPSASAYTFGNFLSGSLGEHLVTQLASLTSGKTSPGYTSAPGPYPWNATSNIFQPDGVTRNTSIWTGSVDLTCIPAFQPNARNGVLIAPDVMLFAKHFGQNIGTPIIFVDNSGNQYPRYAGGGYDISVSSLDDARQDIRICLLDSPLPGSITPCQIAPSNLPQYIPQPLFGYPLVYHNQDSVLCIGSMNHYDTTHYHQLVFSVNSTYPSWGYPGRLYDSGSPVFFIVNGSLVLLTQLYSADSGPNDFDAIAEINAGIAYLGSSSTVTLADLSAFNTY